MKSISIVLFQLLAIAGIAFSNSYVAEFETARKRYEAKETLGYGASCNFADEEKRIRFNGELHDLMSQITSVTAFSIGARSMTKLTNSTTGDFCNSRENFRCNKDTDKCDCQQPDSALPLNITSVWEDNTCKITPGSTCVPAGKGNSLQCQGGTRCVMAENKRTCTYEAISRALLEGHKYPSMNFIHIFKVNYIELVGGICKCL